MSDSAGDESRCNNSGETAKSFLDGRVTVYAGDSRDVLAPLPDASVDSVVCDPPYGLMFMGRAWDALDGAPFASEFWREVLRVLKPGGHMLAFSGTRTYHRMVCAIEDSGFEIRDQLAWLFGSGFPKSHDISKAIDKAGGISPQEQAVLLKRKREAASLTREAVAGAVGCTESSVRDWEEGRARAKGAAIEYIVPSEAYRIRIADLLGYSADERRLVAAAIRRRGDGTVFGLGHTGDLMAGGNTPAAAAWAGWGSALKPAHEPIVLARKPLIGTLAANVLAHGTGGINVDGCRVEADTSEMEGRSGKSTPNNVYGAGVGHDETWIPNATGRFPANVLHDGSEEVIAGFPETASGQPGIMRKGTNDGAAYGAESRLPGTQMTGIGDSGSAARFFYTAKADADDRLGSKHPTVKPLDLMQYLCRLITPPGGTVLDPFAGTGTTGEAAWREGFNAILIEREPEYLADIARRMELATNPSKRAAVAKTKNKIDDYGPLFEPKEAAE